MRKNDITNTNNDQNNTGASMGSILNMLNMMRGGDKNANTKVDNDKNVADTPHEDSNTAQYVGGQPLYGSIDTNPAPPMPSDADISTPPLSRNALRFAEMIRKHDEAVKRIDKNSENK